MTNIFRTMAVTAIMSVRTLVAKFSEEAANEWFPSKEKLSTMSIRSVAAIDGIIILVIATAFNAIIWAILYA